MDIIKIISGAVLAIAISSCSATRVVKPLAKGEKAVSASLGGPAIMFSGAPIFMPLTSLSYAQGLDTHLTVSGSLHTTDLLFGVAHLEGTAAINAYHHDNGRFGVTVSPAMHVMVDFWDANVRTYPQLEALSWWQYGAEKSHLLYGGLGTWIELNKVKAHNQVQTNELLPWVMVGHQWVKPKWNFTVEAKYLGFQHNTQKLVVDYISPFGQGALGVYFGLSRRLVR